jgi:hypothetical protein
MSFLVANNFLGSTNRYLYSGLGMIHARLRWIFLSETSLPISQSSVQYAGANWLLIFFSSFLTGLLREQKDLNVTIAYQGAGRFAGEADSQT